MTFETTYEQVFIDSTTDPQNPVEILRGFTNPPHIDSKFTYNGVDQWIHLIGYWANPSCSSDPLNQWMAPERNGGRALGLLSAGPLKLDTLYGGACRLVREVFYVGEASES